MRSSRIGALVAGAAALLAAGAATAQTKWDMPTPYNDQQFHTLNSRWFAEEVKKATGGQLEVVVHSNNSLIRLPEIFRAVGGGQVNLGEILLAQFGNEDPIYEMDAVPFLATGYKQAKILYEVQKPVLAERLAKRNIRLLYSAPWPGQALYSKNPITTLADFKGVKFRAFSPGTARLAELMGAVPTTLQLSELSQAFATNIVTAMITSAPGGADTKTWEFAKYFYDTKAFLPRNAVIANERAFRALPEAQRNAILEVSARAEERAWMLSEEAEQTATKKLADNGMTVAPPTAQMEKEFRVIGQTMTEEWLKKAGPDGQKLVDAFRAKAN